MTTPNEDNLLVSLADLIDQVTEAQLATEVEKNGIYGWDRFGRFQHFPAGSLTAELVLDLLAERFRHEVRRRDGETPMWFSCEPPDARCLYGWPKKDLPAFAGWDEPSINIS